ncbi:MAG: ATP-binding protein [Pyrinomonadaceae bacterium]
MHGNQRDDAKLVDVTFIATASDLVVLVRDRGVGFEPEAVPDPTDAQHIMLASGRGILFMRAFMDEVVWLRHPDGGTVVRMTKRF